MSKTVKSRLSRIGLIALFSSVFIIMLGFTVRASLVRNVLDNGHLWPDVWFQATFVDAYLGFLTFYVWVAWQEKRLIRRIVWFALIMTLGNMAMSFYVLLQIFRLPPQSNVSDLLTSRSS